MSRRSGRRTPTAAEMVHPAVNAHLQAGYEATGGEVIPRQELLMTPQVGVAPRAGFDARYAQEDSEMMRSMPGVQPPDYQAFADADDIAASRAGGSGAAIGPGQIQGFQGYAQNPLEEEGRARIGQQFMQAPLGGHVRDALDGQEIFGHTITNRQARMAEQGLAGLTAVGVGVPAFMAAVQQLSTPQDQNTIPF
ncbi:MAG: hypothetical protein LW834_00330 [Cyanobium sp. 49614_E6]|jgi:hypothetical protein|nr:hypothetical protein [Cyanobium sp. 49614_E6]